MTLPLSSPIHDVHLFTIGAFGFTEAGFFDALQNAGVDTFCDIRARRGVRGSEYAFVNSTRLQARLAELEIAYRHHLDLAPEPQNRELQYSKDKEAKIAKRKRTELSPEFAHAYSESRLTEFDSAVFLTELRPEARRIALFCVEREPAACHRSLVAERLASDLSLPVTHLLP
jgi:hypothetical protein